MKGFSCGYHLLNIAVFSSVLILKREPKLFLYPNTTNADSVSETIAPIVQTERISIDCRKTKTKLIALANQKGRRQSGKPIKTRSNYT